MKLRAVLFLTLVCSSLAAPGETQGDQSEGGASGFFNSWFDKIFSWFGSFGSPFSTSVNINVEEINNKSASLNCSWSGPGSANLSWTVEDQSVAVSEGELLTITWADLGKEAGDVVFVTCSGQSSGSSASNQTGESAWASVSTVTKNLVVPGTEEGNIPDSSEEINSEEVEDDDDDSEEDEDD